MHLGRILPIKDCKLGDESFINGDHVRLKAIHDISRHGGGVVHWKSLLCEPIHGRWVRWGIIRPEYLLPDCLERVSRVRVHVLGLVLEEEPLRVRVGYWDPVWLRPINSIDFWVEAFHPTKHVVEGTVLHDEDDDGFDGTGLAAMDYWSSEEEDKEEDGNGGGCYFHFCINHGFAICMRVFWI